MTATAPQAPSIGRIVHYKLNEHDAAVINKRRADYQAVLRSEGALLEALRETGLQAHVGNRAEAGHVYPAIIVRTWGSTPESAVQLQVFLDGNDTFWATSVAQGDGERQWSWPR